MDILFAASEAAPFVKIGGLGDVIGALPFALTKLGVKARVILPLYGSIPDKLRNNLTYLKYIYVEHAWRKNYCGIFTTEKDGVTYYFLDNEMYFSRNAVYGEYDDGERFSFFSKAILDVLEALDYYPDIIHANDWHTAMVPVYLHAIYRHRPAYAKIRTVLSIHNIEFQGKYDPYLLGGIFGLSTETTPILMYDGCLNLLKGGIECADAITTVSETYAEEILYPYHSFKLDGILRPRRYKLHGIVNGIDTELFDPKTDTKIAKNYSVTAYAGKKENKRALQCTLDLPQSDAPMFVMVTRLTTQKGLDLLIEVIDEVLKEDLQLVILGTGYREYEEFLLRSAQKHSNKMRAIIAFSAKTAQELYAGGDFFLMPSKSEPCGLSQLIAMRYGAVPVVHTVGGLKDTVEAFNPETGTGTGINFQSYHAQDMLDAILRATAIYKVPSLYRKLRRNAMKKDSSWQSSAEKYVSLYQSLFDA